MTLQQKLTALHVENQELQQQLERQAYDQQTLAKCAFKALKVHDQDQVKIKQLEEQVVQLQSEVEILQEEKAVALPSTT